MINPARKLSLITLSLLFSMSLMAEVKPLSLKEYSEKINKALPAVYDPVTKLIASSVENESLVYHFILAATRVEFSKALPQVRSSVLKSVCSNPREKLVLKEYKANLIYRYESVSGESLGEFMVRPEHCGKKLVKVFR